MLRQRTSLQVKLLFFFIIAVFLPSVCIATKKDTDLTRKKDSEYPMEIQSNMAEFNDEKGVATYTGSVKAKQGSRRLWSDVLTIFRGKDNKISKMIATGKPAKIKSQADPDKPIGNGRAKTIEYYAAEDKAFLIGNAEIEQGGDIIRGQFLTHYFEKDLLISNPVPNARTTVILPPRNKEIKEK